MSTAAQACWSALHSEKRGAKQAWLWPDVTSSSDNMCVVLTAARTKNRSRFLTELAACKTLANRYLSKTRGVSPPAGGWE